VRARLDRDTAGRGTEALRELGRAGALDGVGDEDVALRSRQFGERDGYRGGLLRAQDLVLGIVRGPRVDQLRGVTLQAGLAADV
jgi:hypothetical protein